MKTLLVGYGSIGQRHNTVLRSLFPDSTVYIVSSHVPQMTTPWYHSIADVPHIEDFDYYVIASETAKHRHDLSELLDRVSGKTILVEKPLFADEHLPPVPGDNTIFVGYNLRFHPLLQRIRSILSNSPALSIDIRTGQYLPQWRPGRDYRESYSAHVSRGGGVLFDLSHEIDYLQWMCGKLAEFHTYSGHISSLQIDSDDYLAVIGRTERGTRATVTLDYLCRVPQRRVVVNTTTKTIVADLVEGTWIESDGELRSEALAESERDRNLTYSRMHQHAVARDMHYLCTFEEGLELMKTLSMLREQEREQK